MILEKKTDTHSITMQVGESVNPQTLLKQFTTLGLTLGPNQSRTCGGPDFVVQVETNWKFTNLAFFTEHQEFLDSLKTGTSMEN